MIGKKILFPIVVASSGCCYESYSESTTVTIQGLDNLGIQPLGAVMTRQDDVVVCEIETILDDPRPVVSCDATEGGSWNAEITFTEDRVAAFQIQIDFACGGARGPNLLLELTAEDFTVEEVPDTPGPL